jgi:hypothetical protein
LELAAQVELAILLQRKVLILFLPQLRQQVVALEAFKMPSPGKAVLVDLEAVAGINSRLLVAQERQTRVTLVVLEDYRQHLPTIPLVVVAVRVA